MLKRAVDACLAALALVVAAPLLALIALAIKAESPGPVLYAQPRVGKDGRIFRLYKLRSMVVGADRGAAITGRQDPRITRVGAVIRALRIDELPQFLNVFRGDMSLVGPRPEAPSIVEGYTAEQRAILSARPGLTGPTQLTWLDEASHFPPEADQERYYVDHILPQKLQSDLAYVRTRTLWKDLGYLLWTPVEIARGVVRKRQLPRLEADPRRHQPESRSGRHSSVSDR